MPALREILADFGIKFPTAEAKKADASIEALVGSVKGFAVSLGAGLALGAIKDFVFGLVNQADALRDQATALGLSVEQLQAWNHAGELNGVTAEGMAGALTKFNRNVNEATKGTGPAADSFKALGLALKDSSGKLRAPIDLLDGVAAGLQNIQDPAKRTAIVMDLFGRAGAKLLPLFSEGPEGLKKLREEVAQLGGGITTAFAEQADELNDNIARLDLSILSFKVQVVSRLVPALTAAVVAGTKLSNWVREAVKRTKLLETGMSYLALRGVVFLSTKIGPLGALFRSLAGFVLKTVAPLLLLEDIFIFLAGGDSLIGRAMDRAFGKGTQEKVRGFTDSVKEAVGSFSLTQIDEFFAFLQKDIAKSKSNWKGFGQAVIQEGQIVVSALTGGWSSFFSKLRALLDAAVFVFAVGWEGVKNQGLLAAAALSDGWANAWNSVLSGAEYAINSLKALLAKLPAVPDWVVKAVGKAAASVESSKKPVNAVETAQAAAKDRGRALAARGEDIQDRLGIGVPQVKADARVQGRAQVASGAEVPERPAVAAAPIINNHTTNNTKVEVAPGTPVEQARDVAKAAEKGVNRGDAALRAAHAALVHQEG